MGDSKRNAYLLHFDKMCRLCLSQNLDIVYIFNQNYQDNSSIKDRIKECITLEVSENDGLPQNICNNCLQKLNDWYDFRNNCIQSESILRGHLCENVSQKAKEVITFDANNSFSISLTDQVKSEKEDDSNIVMLSEVKQEESDNSPEELFSESDEKPLIEMTSTTTITTTTTTTTMTTTATEKKKKKDKVNIKKSKKERDSNKPLVRGRAPKAKPLCLVCHQKFSRFVELIEHQNKVHSLNISDVSVNNENGLEELKVNIDAFAVFKCHVCKKEFSGREDLRTHCKTVHNTKVIQPYPCSHCDRQFPAWGLLVVHERKHTGEKPYSCDVCGKQNFISQTSLRRHKLMHLKVYSCQDCGRDFNCDSALKAHIRCKHTNEKPYLCNICGRSFSLSAILTAHMTSHSTERKYICDVCGFASKTSGNHYRHKNTHKTGGAKSFHCETCGKSFDSKLKLTSHQIIHRPVRPHVCKVCGKAFLYNNKLERHILLVHAKERPFPCTLCGKKLASKFGLGIHLKTHNRNDRPKVEPPEVQ